MLEIVVFAVVLAVAMIVGNIIGAMAMMKYFMRKETLKHYTKMTMNVAKEIEEEMWEED